jgi:hypothetical protein
VDETGHYRKVKAMASKLKGLAALEAAYYRRLYEDAEADLSQVSLVYPGKDVTAKVKVEEVKPVPARQSNRRVRDGLERAE